MVGDDATVCYANDTSTPTNASHHLHGYFCSCGHSVLSIVYYSAILRKRRNQKTSIGDTPKELPPFAMSNHPRGGLRHIAAPLPSRNADRQKRCSLISRITRSDIVAVSHVLTSRRGVMFHQTHVGDDALGIPPTNASHHLHGYFCSCGHSVLSIVYYSAFLRKRRNQKTSIGDTPKELCPLHGQESPVVVGTPPLSSPEMGCRRKGDARSPLTIT